MRFLLLLALPALTACPAIGTSCTEEYRSSVTVYLYDESNTAIEQADLSYRIDGGAWTECESFSGAFVCGWETPGAFEIEVSAMGYAEQTLTVDVIDTDDGCHVVSESLTAVLEALECTEIVVAAVEVSVFDAAGEPASDALVTWFNTTLGSDSETCEAAAGSNVYSCGFEEWGEISIQADGGGQAGSTSVFVDHDGCHPITESIDLQMDWLPD